MELRQRADDLERQMSGRQSSSPTGQRGNQSAGQSSPSGQQQSKEMHDVAQEMQNAAGDLRRQDLGQASARGGRALEKLHQLEREAQASRLPGASGAHGPQAADDRRRALGDMQLETRQLADAQRQVASELAKAGQDDAARDSMRRLAGEEDRLAERAKRLQDGLKQLPSGDAAHEIDQQRFAERMEKSAEEMRAAAGSAAPARAGAQQDVAQGQSGAQKGTARGQAGAQQDVARRQQDMARALDKVADKLGTATGDRDGESRKLSEQLTRAQALRDRMNALGQEVERAGQQKGATAGQSGSVKTPGDTGRAGRGQSGGGAPGSDLARLREEYARQLKETGDLLDQLRRDDPSFAHGGVGFTFEGQGMTLSAPGTEAFKQDFAKWDELRRQATTALEQAESSLSKKLQAQQSKDRLAAGVEDKAPPEYQKQVDSYFKAIATKKKP
jgi:hypothetical protein